MILSVLQTDLLSYQVLEETGYNLSGQIREADCIRLCIKQQPITLFVVPSVPEDFPFKTQTRKEISVGCRWLYIVCD